VALRCQVLFYCHFPDMLLAQRSSPLRALYRAPLDALEQFSTGYAHAVLVNSKFTAAVFARTFTWLHARGMRPTVLYPAVDVDAFAAVPPPPSSPAARAAAAAALAAVDVCGVSPYDVVLLSINRFERKKGLALAIDALADVRRTGGGVHLILAGAQASSLHVGDPNSSAPVRWAVGGRSIAHRLWLFCQWLYVASQAGARREAGGYDARLAENVEHLAELRAAATAAGMAEHVTFVPSFTAPQRAALLAAAVAVLYTPQHEHFGIVPLEAMAAGRAVLACASGGPLESIVHQRTVRRARRRPTAHVH
jgi:alpha-1,3/alpha-1,6-mannosyltransferase